MNRTFDTRCFYTPRAHSIMVWIKAMVFAIGNGLAVYSIKTHRRIELGGPR